MWPSHLNLCYVQDLFGLTACSCLGIVMIVPVQPSDLILDWLPVWSLFNTRIWMTWLMIPRDVHILFTCFRSHWMMRPRWSCSVRRMSAAPRTAPPTRSGSLFLRRSPRSGCWPSGVHSSLALKKGSPSCAAPAIRSESFLRNSQNWSKLV